MLKIDKLIEHAVGVVINYLPHVVGAILLWVLGTWVINRLSAFLGRAMEAREIDISLRGFLKSLVSISLKVFLLFSIASALGIETTSFVTVLGAAGLAVGLALQGSLSNFAGGVLILIFKPFKVGDTIDAQSKIGKVQEIQIFNTILLTNENKSVIIPNGPLSNGTIVNISKEGALVFEINLDIDGKQDFNFVKKILLDLIQLDSRVSNPKVNIIKLGNATTLAIKGTTAVTDQGDVVADLNQVILSSFQKNSIIFASKEK